jgi:hypothetical protein
MEKLDLRKKYKILFAPSPKKAEIVDVPELQFAMLDGEIEAGAAPAISPAFQEAVQALYGISYTLKFMAKADPRNPVDYQVMPLEALWWRDGGAFDFSSPGGWQWTVMIVQPEPVTFDLFNEGLAKLRKKNPSPAVELLRLETFREGLSVQIMHIGPYADEPPTIQKMHSFAHENGYSLCGKHHEIYLGDPRRSAPEKLKTILRNPVEKPR